jgi:hypothetical protein
MKGRYESKAKYDSPGPGAYDYNKDPKMARGPAYKMGGRHSMLNNTSPDPGPQYDPNFNAVKPRAPGAGFGKAGRSGMKASDSPGPGNYNYNSDLGKKGFKMGGRNEPKMGASSFSPGPGAYN